jgi:hypothetical protein
MKTRAIGCSLFLVAAASVGIPATVEAQTSWQSAWQESSPKPIDTAEANQVARDAYCDLGLIIRSLKTRHVHFDHLNYDTTVSLNVVSGTKSDVKTGGSVIVVSGSAQTANQQTFTEEQQFHQNGTPDLLLKWCVRDKTKSNPSWLNGLKDAMTDIDSGAAPTDFLYREVRFQVSRDTNFQGGVNYVATLEGSYSTSVTTTHWLLIKAQLPPDEISAAQNEWFTLPTSSQVSNRQTRRSEKTSFAQNEWWQAARVPVTPRAAKASVVQNRWWQARGPSLNVQASAQQARRAGEMSVATK